MMSALSIALLVFIILESTNIIILYFFPGAKKGNGIGVFNAFEKSKADTEIHELIKYLINWVAGTKLIFIALLIVILFKGDETLKLLAVIVLIPSIASFYWRLYPAIRKMDRNDQISPKGYSGILLILISLFLAGFVTALIISLLL